MRRFTVLLGLTALAVGAAVGGAGPATAAGPAACTGTVQITGFTFTPATGSPGQTATATLTAQNCTNQPVSATATWSGRFVGAGGGVPAGCPVIDPLARPADFAAGGTITQSTGYLVFSGCTATDLQVTVRITAGGVLLAQQTADLLLQAARPTCSVSYDRQSEWSTGFVATVTVTNLGSVGVDGWTLTFDFPGDQAITNAWSAVVTQTGRTVTAHNASWNGPVPPTGGRVSFGFYGTWATSDASPTSFTFNGNACTTG